MSFSNQWVNLLLAIDIVAQSTVGMYVLQLYMPMYAVKPLHFPATASFAVVVLDVGLQFIFSPLIAHCPISSAAFASCSARPS